VNRSEVMSVRVMWGIFCPTKLGRRTKLTEGKRKRVVDVVDENPILSLIGIIITNKANVGISEMNVKKILDEFGFCL